MEIRSTVLYLCLYSTLYGRTFASIATMTSTSRLIPSQTAQARPTLNSGMISGICKGMNKQDLYYSSEASHIPQPLPSSGFCSCWNKG
ncbi:hypothetical protein VTO42DRAFT_2477 [Malbranchea cinnamomea]